MAPQAALSKLLNDWPLLAAIGILIVAGALRIAPLGESLWLDELHTAWCALGPLDEVSQRAAMGNQAPLYFWLQWLIVNVLGANECSLRLISLISGSVLPFSVFLFARRWHLSSAGLVAAALIATDHLSIFYATEARPYALVQLLAVIHLAVTAGIAFRSTVPLRVAWVLLAAAMFYLHFTTALLIGTEAAFLLLARLTQIRRSLAHCTPIAKDASISDSLIDLAAVGLLCLPQLTNLHHVFAHRANWAAFVSREPIWKAIEWTPLPLWSWAVLMVASGVAWIQAAARGARVKQDSGAQTCLVIICSFLLPIFIAWLTTWTDFARLFFARYVAGALPAAALCAGLCISAIHWPFVRAALAVGTIGSAAWNSGVIQQIATDGRVIADRNEDWRGCVQWLNERIAAEGYPVLVYSGLIEADELTKPHDELLDEYCLCPVNSLYFLDAAPSDIFPLPLHKPGQLPQVAEQLILHRGGCWLIVRGNKETGQKVATQICSALQRSDPDAKEDRWVSRLGKSFGRVHVQFIAGP